MKIKTSPILFYSRSRGHIVMCKKDTNTNIVVFVQILLATIKLNFNLVNTPTFCHLLIPKRKLILTVYTPHSLIHLHTGSSHMITSNQTMKTYTKIKENNF